MENLCFILKAEVKKFPESVPELHQLPGAVLNGEIVIITGSLAAGCNQAGCFQDFQVMRYSWSGQVGFFCDFSHIQSVLPQVFRGKIMVTPLAGGIRQSLNDGKAYFVTQSNEKRHALIKLILQSGSFQVGHDNPPFPFGSKI